jgi:hypothetical protein
MLLDNLWRLAMEQKDEDEDEKDKDTANDRVYAHFPVFVNDW